MIQKIKTNMAPAAIGPYSQAVMDENYIFLSGQIPIDPATGEVVEADITVQAEQVISNIKGVLAEAGVSIENTMKTGCFLADMKDFQDFNAVYAKHFTSNPARSCVAVKSLPKNVLCEIEVIVKK